MSLDVNACLHGLTSSCFCTCAVIAGRALELNKAAASQKRAGGSAGASSSAGAAKKPRKQSVPFVNAAVRAAAKSVKPPPDVDVKDRGPTLQP